MAENENVEDERNLKRVKTEPQADQLDEKIAKQVEYYFSDVNLYKDKFLQAELSKNNNRVKLSVIATFNRLKELTTDENKLAEVLENFKSDIMELDKDKKEVVRTKPLPDRDEYQKELDIRTVHISGFPDTTEFETLRKFCGQFGEVESLAMRKYIKTRHFKGCIHVVFRKKDAAERVFQSEPLLFRDRELRREKMEDYHKRKQEMREKMKQKKLDKKGKKHTNSVEVKTETEVNQGGDGASA